LRRFGGEIGWVDRVLVKQAPGRVEDLNRQHPAVSVPPTFSYSSPSNFFTSIVQLSKAIRLLSPHCVVPSIKLNQFSISMKINRSKIVRKLFGFISLTDFSQFN
jgi:hypothetical protein